MFTEREIFLKEDTSNFWMLGVSQSILVVRELRCNGAFLMSFLKTISPFFENAFLKLV